MIGKHGYSGACRPGAGWASQQTFSVGIFEWLPKASGNGEKKSAVKVRVSGPVSMPREVERRAAEIVKELDAGTYCGPKKVKV